MPIIDLSGFPGYPAQNIAFTRCTGPENAEIKLAHVKDIRIDIQEAGAL